jgi:hypothetical protein
LKFVFAILAAILLLDGKTLKSRHLVGTLFYLPREAEAAAIQFEAGAHGDISAGNQEGKDLRSAKSVAARFQ